MSQKNNESKLHLIISHQKQREQPRSVLQNKQTGLTVCEDEVQWLRDVCKNNIFIKMCFLSSPGQNAHERNL